MTLKGLGLSDSNSLSYIKASGDKLNSTRSRTLFLKLIVLKLLLKEKVVLGNFLFHILFIESHMISLDFTVLVTCF